MGRRIQKLSHDFDDLVKVVDALDDVSSAASPEAASTKAHSKRLPVQVNPSDILEVAGEKNSREAIEYLRGFTVKQLELVASHIGIRLQERRTPKEELVRRIVSKQNFRRQHQLLKDLRISGSEGQSTD